jgi:membrane-associated phospholipid phosphatase
MAWLTHEISGLDRGVDRAFDRIRGNKVADRVFYGASALGDHGLIWLIAAAAHGLRSERHLRGAVRAAAGVGIESALVNLGIKSLFRRGRPSYQGPRPHRLRHPRTSSFPSGHATSAFCAAALLSEGDGWWPLYYGAALVVAWSRVYVRIHHASDVIAGIAIGHALGRIGRRLFPIPGPEGES